MAKSKKQNRAPQKHDEMQHQQAQGDGLSQAEIEGQQAKDLPDREATSLIDVGDVNIPVDVDALVNAPINVPVDVDALVNAPIEANVGIGVNAPIDIDAAVGINAPINAEVNAPITADVDVPINADVDVPIDVDADVDAPINVAGEQTVNQ